MPLIDWNDSIIKGFNKILWNNITGFYICSKRSEQTFRNSRMMLNTLNCWALQPNDHLCVQLKAFYLS